MATSMKIKFAGLLRGLLRQLDGGESLPSARPAMAAAPMAAPVAVPTANQFSAPPPTTKANEIEVPLAPVVAALPMELRAKLMSVPPAGMTICLPVETAISQLAFGAVKISFGELRQLAPGIFANSGGEHDNRLISLPLQEILPRLNPALLARRPVQQIEVNAEIAGPFDGRGRGFAFTTQPLKASAPTPAPLPKPVVMRAENPIAPPLPNIQRTLAPPLPAPPVRPVTIPMTMAAPAPAPVMPRPAPAQPTIFAALSDLCEKWPEELKNEIIRSPLANASVPLAVAAVEAGLKRGRVTMTWKQLRALARPSSLASPNDNLELDLPLKVIAPMFFAAQKNLLKAQPKVSVSAEIPDLFFGFPQAAPEPPPVRMAASPVQPAPVESERKTADTNFYIRGDSNEASKTASEFELPIMPQTDFTHRQAHPREVVARAAALPGVAGAVVSLPDGLCVASQVSTGLNADSLAAFLPQIFDRVNQSTRELRMGALNNVSFTVGNVPWKIFRVSSVYFAAFGRAGESLPSAQLAQMAVELDRRKQQ